jgi:uncharacterized protein
MVVWLKPRESSALPGFISLSNHRITDCRYFVKRFQKPALAGFLLPNCIKVYICSSIVIPTTEVIMGARISHLFQYPVKGMKGNTIQSLDISDKLGVIGDRRFALQKSETLKTGQWNPKAAFYVGMNTPPMVSIQPHSISLERLPSRVAECIGLAKAPPLIEAGDTYNLTDTEGPTISLLNLATVRALSDFLGQEINPERFRMNIWVEGLPPFAELDWATTYPGNQILDIVATNGQSLEFEVFDACERCPAINANPETGMRDIELHSMKESHLNRFMDVNRPHYKSPQRSVASVMGVLMKPMQGGSIAVGDQITV